MSRLLLAGRRTIPAVLTLQALACSGQLTDEQKRDAFSPPSPNFEAVVSQPERLDDSDAIRVTFPSAVQSEWPQNNTVHAILVTPVGSNARLPVVVLLHALGAADHSVEYRIASRLNEVGIAALLVTLPYHIERAPPGHRTGTLMLTPDPAKLRTNLTQAVSDVRRAVDWLQQSGRVDKDKIGILGVSLGAIMAESASAVDPRFRFVALVLGGGDVAHIVYNSIVTIPLRESLRRKGWTEERLRAELADVEPLNYVTPELGTRTFLIGARFDTVVPAGDTKKLHDALGDPPMLWLETNHYGAALVENRVMRLVAEFFQARFAGRDWTPPASIYAPTIRLGLTLDAGNKLQVAAGMDLWRSNTKGDFFADVLLTTRGPALFAGWRGRMGIAPGILIFAKRTVPGLLWHFIL